MIMANSNVYFQQKLLDALSLVVMCIYVYVNKLVDIIFSCIYPLLYYQPN
jgi:hypothetical protein